MKINENQWNSMETNENQRKSMKIGGRGLEGRSPLSTKFLENTKSNLSRNSSSPAQLKSQFFFAGLPGGLEGRSLFHEEFPGTPFCY